MEAHRGRKGQAGLGAALAVALCCGAGAGSFAGDAGGTRTLFDYRQARSYDPPKIARERKRDILRAVYGANGASRSVSINSALSGSFTRAGARETAYILQPQGPMTLDPNSLKATRLAVFAGRRLVLSAPLRDYNFLVRAADVNGDGRDELLAEGSFMNMGTTVSWAGLFAVRGSGARLLREFKQAHDDSCSGKEDGVTAAMIRYRPRNRGAMPTFTVDYYRAACPDANTPSRYRKVPPPED